MLICGVLTSCSNDKKTPVNHASDIKAPALTPPFRYHKLVEVSPGQYYDILSWGRASVDTGAFLILHSDSSGKKYTTTTGDLNGTITDVFNTDMDVDGNPEILIQAKRKDTINYTTIYAFEFSDNKAQKLDFPKLTSSQRKGYRGGDNFYIEEGKLTREFPIYEGNGSSAKPTGQKRKLEYGLSSNSFTVKQLSKDSTTKSTQKPVEPKVSKKNEPVKKTETKETKKSKKHHSEPVRHKKHKKHRNSDDDDN
jgi:hypothetical protein